MHKPHLILALALLLASAQLAYAQTPDARERPMSPSTTSFKNNNPEPNTTDSYSKEQLKRRSQEAKRFYDLGQKFGRANLFRQAAEVFQKAIDLRPDYADAYFGLGHAYYDLGRWQDAITAFEKVIELNPKDTEAFERLHMAEAKLREQQGTSSTAETNSSVVSNVNDSAAVEGSELLKTYKVGVGDVIEVASVEGSSQPISFTVPDSGIIEYASLEQPVHVLGLTQEEIAQSLNAHLKQSSPSQPANLTVTVREYHSHAIMISGLVKEPGTKILRREAIPLYVVLADAQPLPEANQVVVVSRTGEPVRLDLVEAQSRNLLVRPGDVITVQVAPTSYFYVGGEVKEPGEKVFRQGMTLTQAILAAGGVTERGKSAEIGRETAQGLLSTTSYKLKDITAGKVPDVPIQPGDRIVVVH